MLLDAATLRLHVETDLQDPALELLSADAEAAIVGRWGPNVGVSETATFDSTGTLPVLFPGSYFRPGEAVLFFDRPIATVSSVTELVPTSVTLATNDYLSLYGGRALRRLSTGTHPRSRWSSQVTVVYVPVDDTPQRKRVIVDLVKLALRYNAAKEVLVGNVREYAYDDYTEERQHLIDELQPDVMVR